MTDRLIIRDLATLQQHRGGCGQREVEFAHGEFALDVLGHATAADMLIALRAVTGSEVAKAIVEFLLDNNLLFDSTIEGELGNA